MLIVTGYIHVDPQGVPQFLAELKDLAAMTRQRSGNISYDAAVDDPAAGRLLIVERWANQEALIAHLDAQQTKAFVARWQGRMRGDVRKFDASNERGLLD
ncbi:antibiotic biosynthesis monooxygenase [Rhizobium sp. S101]|uniref:Antibiotic biosynthesis monooxygenase n=2 Tax=Rhizobiaceae TaxID=82115 RepID=A0AAJ1C032_9HYPH|nr:antibiotic biosynthesis monooxygenase [Ciceribacter sp. S101]